ncbi:unnamed protein product [Arctia plantaginis]|uniref:Uncharacterized protein n=1 Tax=Arctia plantaginis TaxID=874455 RepID=A0A8S1B6Z7_ARCPL|nr:unnamed protein product [Arctia plantaginis]
MPIGKLEPFDVNSKQWPAYIRRVKQYILLNEIKDELRVPLLITVVSEHTYSLMCDLCAPKNPKEKSFDELIKAVLEYLEPQRAGGWEAVELALALEAAERHAEVSGATAPVSASGASVGEGLHSTRAGSAGTSGGGERRTSRYRGAGAKGPNSAASSISLQCWRCGKAHRPDRCRYVNYNCDECNQRGHLKVMCREVQANRSDRQNYVIGYAEDEDLFNIELASKDALRPDVAQVARKAQQRQIANAGGTPQPSILLGDPVLARDYSVGKNKWSTGTVTEQTGPVSYRVNMDVLVQLDGVIDLFNFT